jgi:hypothetical protein
MENTGDLSKPTAVEASGGLREGIILWRLTFRGQRDLWCMVFDTSSGYFLVLDDDPGGSAPLRASERYAEIISLVNRAEALKSVFMTGGWVDLDVD